MVIFVGPTRGVPYTAQLRFRTAVLVLPTFLCARLATCYDHHHRHHHFLLDGNAPGSKITAGVKECARARAFGATYLKCKRALDQVTS
jgi:hypothetical protein